MSETIRTVKSGRFSIIDNQILEDAALSLQAKGLQAYLLSRPDGWNISPSHLATTCRGGVSQIKATLKELELARYIHREQLRDDKGRMAGWINWIYENPALNPHRLRELSASRKSASRKSACGESTPINTELINTDLEKEITNSLTLTRSTGNTESLISEQPETSTPDNPNGFACESKPNGLNALESRLDSSNEQIHQQAREEVKQGILEGNQNTNNPSLESNPDPSEEKDPPVPRTTKLDKNKTVWGRERPIFQQKERAQKASDGANIKAGIQHSRWKDREDYSRFEAYVVEHIRQVNLGLKKDFEPIDNPETYLRGVLNKTANCTDEDSADLICWKNWNSEIQSPEFVAATPPPLIEMSEEDKASTIAKTLQRIADMKARDAIAKTDEASRQKKYRDWLEESVD